MDGVGERGPGPDRTIGRSELDRRAGTRPGGPAGPGGPESAEAVGPGLGSWGSIAGIGGANVICARQSWFARGEGLSNSGVSDACARQRSWSCCWLPAGHGRLRVRRGSSTGGAHLSASDRDFPIGPAVSHSVVSPIRRTAGTVPGAVGPPTFRRLTATSRPGSPS